MIEREMIEEMFANMHENGVNTDEELLWGFFFADRDPAKLEAAIPVLTDLGYEFVDIMEAECEDDDEAYFLLQVERVETHTVDSLHARNQEFYAFAKQNGIEAYDGMDVGRPDGEPFDS